jgi:ABC-2 type transport system ATP-binding protein
MRALVATFPHAKDFEISGAGLEEAFLQLTGTSGTDSTGSRP